eukprot:6169913-Pleurochrysis_carterae.AAC.1
MARARALQASVRDTTDGPHRATDASSGGARRATAAHVARRHTARVPAGNSGGAGGAAAVPLRTDGVTTRAAGHEGRATDAPA